MTKEFNLSDEVLIAQRANKEIRAYLEEDVKEFIQNRIYDSTRLLALFNQGKLTSIDLREHRQKIKDEAGKELIDNHTQTKPHDEEGSTPIESFKRDKTEDKEPEESNSKDLVLPASSGSDNPKKKYHELSHDEFDEALDTYHASDNPSPQLNNSIDNKDKPEREEIDSSESAVMQSGSGDDVCECGHLKEEHHIPALDGIRTCLHVSNEGGAHYDCRCKKFKQSHRDDSGESKTK